MIYSILFKYILYIYLLNLLNYRYGYIWDYCLQVSGFCLYSALQTNKMYGNKMAAFWATC